MGTGTVDVAVGPTVGDDEGLEIEPTSSARGESEEAQPYAAETPKESARAR